MEVVNEHDIVAIKSVTLFMVHALVHVGSLVSTVFKTLSELSWLYK